MRERESTLPVDSFYKESILKIIDSLTIVNAESINPVNSRLKQNGHWDFV